MQRFIAIVLVLIGSLAAGNRCYGQFNNGFVSTAPPGANVENTTNASEDEEVIMRDDVTAKEHLEEVKKRNGIE